MSTHFHSKNVEKAYQDYAAGRDMAVYAKSITDVEKAKSLLSGLIKGLSSPESPEFREASKALDQIVNSHNDFRSQIYTEPILKAFGAEVNKGITNSVMPMMPRTVVEFRNMFAEDAIDDYWQFVYQTDVVTDTFSMQLATLRNLVTFKQLKSATDKIPFGPYMASDWENLEGVYFGGGVAVAEEILMKDPLTNINGIIVALRIGSEILRTTIATTNIQAGIVAANGAGYTQAFATNIPNTINQGRYTLAQRVKGNGYGINRQTPYVLIANESLEELIESNFRETNNVPFGTLRVNRPMTRIYTNNLSVSLGISGVKALLVLPYRECRYGQFKNLTIQAWNDFETDSRKVGGREAYNFLTNYLQFQLINLN